MSFAAAAEKGTRRLLVRRSETSDQRLLEVNLTPLSEGVAVVAKSYFSIHASNYLQPIADQLQRLMAGQWKGMPGVKANELESDGAMPVIVLVVAMIESWLVRIRVDRQDLKVTSQAVDYYDSIRDKAASPDLAEVFVLRNAISHNHVWEVHYNEGDDGTWSRIRVDHLFGHPTKAFKAAINTDTCTTNVHGLHFIPSMIDRTDVAKVLSLAAATAAYLVAAKLSHQSILNHRAILAPKGKRVTLEDLAEMARQ